MWPNFVTLDGQSFVKVEEQLIVEPWIMFVHKSLRGKTMMIVWTSGALVFLLMNF